MSELAPYAVDLELLEGTVAGLARDDARFEALLDQVRRRVAALHTTWEGEAAGAHLVAQADWERGFAAMREGLAGVRAAARHAQLGYEGAVAANLRLWGAA